MLMVEMKSWLKFQSGPGMLIISSNGAGSGVNINEAPVFSVKLKLCLDRWSAAVLTICAICSHTRSIL